MKALLAFAILLVGSACSSVQVEGDPDFALVPGSTFAWSIDRDRPIESGVPYDEYLRAVIAEFGELEVQRATTATADYLVDLWVRVQVDVRENDPYFQLVVAEEFEEAIVRLEIHEGRSDELLWAGEVRHRLRFTRRSFGGLPPRWEPVAEDREWFVQREIERLFGAIPVEAR